MNDLVQRRYDRATRVRTFGEDSAADFADGGKAIHQPQRCRQVVIAI